MTLISYSPLPMKNLLEKEKEIIHQKMQQPTPTTKE